MESNMNRIVAPYRSGHGMGRAGWRSACIGVLMAGMMTGLMAWPPMLARLVLLPMLVIVAATPATPAMAQGSEAFYEGLGGEAGIKKIVDSFLAIILVDPRIAHQFKELDQPHFVAKLAEQFCQLSGGPCQYSGKGMKDIHDGLNITNAQFNALAEDLQYAMEQHGIPNRIQNKLVAKLAPMQREIVTK